jgi:hypothetical protein
MSRDEDGEGRLIALDDEPLKESLIGLLGFRVTADQPAHLSQDATQPSACHRFVLTKQWFEASG